MPGDAEHQGNTETIKQSPKSLPAGRWLAAALGDGSVSSRQAVPEIELWEKSSSCLRES